MCLLLNDAVKQTQKNVIVVGPKSIVQIDANSSNLLVIIAARRSTYKKCVKRKNAREKLFVKSVYMCHVNKNEITGLQRVSNYSINVNIEGVAIPMDIDTGSAVNNIKKQFCFLSLRNANLSTLDRPSLILKIRRVMSRFVSLMVQDRHCWEEI